jgi:hypothetical protein
MRTPHALLACLFVLTASGALACSAAPGDDEATDADDALTLGSRFRSPLEPGNYLADDGSSARIESSLTTQDLGFVFAKTNVLGRSFVDEFSGAGEVDVTGGTLRLSSDDPASCALDLSPSGPEAFRAAGTCRMKAAVGNVAAVFRRVPKDAWAGKYVSDDARVVLEVTASDDDRLAFSVKVAGIEVLRHERGGEWNAKGFAYHVAEKGCEVDVNVERSRGKNEAFLVPTYGNCGFPFVLLRP